MNYLAHLYLADDDPESIIGNLMGDFVKGVIDARYPAGLRSGIALHRKVDSFSDQHPVILQSKRRIRPPYRRYAGILIDMFFDHFLAVHWNEYSAQSLNYFSSNVYRVLGEHFQRLPPRMQRSVGYMLQHDLLMSYRQIQGIERSLAGIERRLKKPFALTPSIKELEQNYAKLEQDFKVFFPLLIGYAERQKRQLAHSL